MSNPILPKDFDRHIRTPGVAVAPRNNLPTIGPVAPAAEPPKAKPAMGQKLSLKPKKKKKYSLPEVTVDKPDVSYEELFPQKATVTALGQELELKRNMLGMATLQGVIMTYYDGSQESMSLLDQVFAMSYAFTKSARVALKKKPGVDKGVASQLSNIGFEDWCDLHEDYENLMLAMAAAFGGDEDTEGNVE